MHEKRGSSLLKEEGHEASSRNTLCYIMLGLLQIRPMSGYDIKQTFERAVASYWNAGTSQIYTTLKSLYKAELIKVEVIVQTSRPNRKVYQLTEAGQNELARWRQESVPERFTKDEFLAKLFFCGQTDDDEIALTHLRQHRKSLQEQLNYMKYMQQEYGSRQTRRPHLLEYQLLVREYKEAELTASLEVTNRAIARLEEQLQHEQV
jgi:DNA-binding PadR family transcriptional regulator